MSLRHALSISLALAAFALAGAAAASGKTGNIANGKQKAEFNVPESETLAVFDGQLWGAATAPWTAPAKDGKDPDFFQAGADRFDGSNIAQWGKLALFRAGKKLHAFSKSTKEKPEWSIDMQAVSEYIAGMRTR